MKGMKMIVDDEENENLNYDKKKQSVIIKDSSVVNTLENNKNSVIENLLV